MEFDADKCEVILITTKKNSIIYPYQIHQTTFRSTDQAKYLGVTITPDLSWKCHIGNITKKANSTIAFLRRNIRSSPRDAKAKAYKTCVRPIVEYASTVWSSARTTMLNKIKHNFVDRTPDPPFRNARISNDNPEQFSQHYVRKNVYQNSFFPGTTVLWNRHRNT